ncbi:MAG: GNAT family N-acetyltransferase [Chloroflexota bacterium]
MQDYEYPRALMLPDSVFTLRPVRMTDIDGLRCACWRDKSVSYCADRIRRMSQSQARKQGLGVVVEGDADCAVLAYGQIMRLAKRVEISDLIVAETHRSQGIGTAMIQYLIHEMRQMRQLTQIEIGVLVRNTRALTLYRRLGFVNSYQLSLRINKVRETVQYLRLTIPADT